MTEVTPSLTDGQQEFPVLIVQTMKAERHCIVMAKAGSQDDAIKQFKEGDTEVPNWDGPVWVDYLTLEKQEFREPTHDEAKNWLSGLRVDSTYRLVEALEACLEKVELALEEHLDSACVRDPETGDAVRESLTGDDESHAQDLESAIAKARAALAAVRP